MTTMQTIEVEGLPEGWKAVAFRKPLENERYINRLGDVDMCTGGYANVPVLIVEKIQPRRIVLEETAEVRKVKRNEYYIDRKGNLAFWSINCESIEKYNIVREVTETDIPLTNEEPKLSLSVAECKRIVNCTASDVVPRILEFIKDK